ncbi:MAG: FAD-binding oxidoreductase [Pseudohongiellaceae bacterium]
MEAPGKSYSAKLTRQLGRQLQSAVRGEVRFDEGSRALYATDGSLYREVPIGVVVPRSSADVQETLAICRKFEVPVMPRGAGTSLAGQCCNVAVVLDFSKYMHNIQSIDPQQKVARVQPGCVLDELRNAAEIHHLTFAPDPSTHSHNTLGGMIGNNSCGVHSLMGGRTADNVESLEVVTYRGERMEVGYTSESDLAAIIAHGGHRGEIYRGLRDLRDRYGDLVRSRFPDIPRRVSGYSLDELLPERGFNVARALVGSEGTCAIALSAELKLVPSPPRRVLLIAGYKDVYACGDHVPDILEYEPIGLEGIDSVLIESMATRKLHVDERRQLPEGNSWLLIEFGGDTEEEAHGKAQRLQSFLETQPEITGLCLITEPRLQVNFWKVREAGLAATSRHPTLGAAHPGWEDAAVPPEKVGSYLRDFRELMHAHGYEAALYGHFGQGCIHCRINFDLESESGMRQWGKFMQDAADMVVSYGGSLSGEHGDGQVRGELMPRMYARNSLPHSGNSKQSGTRTGK